MWHQIFMAGAGVGMFLMAVSCADPEGEYCTTYYADLDQDGYGDTASAVQACSVPPGYVTNILDCDDRDPATNPSQYERCDGIDNDCDGQIDTPDSVDATISYVDEDGDGYGDSREQLKACGIPAEAAAQSGDCDDQDEEIHPGAIEFCDGTDNDCDGEIDGATAVGAGWWYVDADLDGYGSSSSVYACEKDGYSQNSSDCNDSREDIHPDSNDSSLDGVDQNCDGVDGVLPFFEASMVDASCKGTTTDSKWYFSLENYGEATEYPYVLIYDNPDWYDGDTNAVWNELVTLYKTTELPGTPTSQLWERANLPWVDSFNMYVEDQNTIFRCENCDFLTYVFCGTEASTGKETCVAVGRYPELFQP